MFKDREVIAEERYQVPVVLETCSGGGWGHIGVENLLILSVFGPF